MANKGDESSFITKTFTRRDLLKGAVVVGAGAALAPVIAACGGGSTTTSPSASAAAGTPKPGGYLRVAVAAGSAKENLDIHVAALTMPSMDIRFNVYDSLLEFSPTGVLGMALAESVEPNADATEFVVKLKQGLVFHNGKDVTADDVVWTFQRIMNPKTGGLATKQLIGLTTNGIKKVDNLTVKFTLEQPNAVFQEGLASYASGVVPQGYDPYLKGGKGAIGTGPFKVEVFTPGQKCDMAKFTEYWREGGGPYVDKLSLIEFNDTTAQLNSLLGGNTEYCQMVPGAQIKVAEAQGFKRLESKTGSWIPFTMNLDVKPFDNVKVRQAFRLIVDRQQMIDQSADGLAWMGNDMYAPYDPGYAKDLPQRAQDIEQAKALLKEAGFDGNLSVKLTTSTSVSSNAPAAATVFAQQAKAAGVDVKVNNVSGDVFWGDEYLKYGFAMDNWGTRGYLLQTAMGTLPGAVYDETKFSKYYPDYVKLVEEAFKTVDDAKRNELITEASTIEYNEGGYIIPMFDNQVDMHSAKVAGMVPDFSGLGSAAANARYRLAYFV